MSMNVADSTDLIHGGGGSLGNFWRSRTDFEQKLLVAMGIMSLVIIAMTVAVIVLAVENGKNNPGGPTVKINRQLPDIKSTSGAKEVSVTTPEEAALYEIGETAPPSGMPPSAPSRYEDTSVSQMTLQSEDSQLQQEALSSPSFSSEEYQDGHVTDERSSPNQSYVTERLLMSL
ncbi:uncharacterized protein LOC135210274 isoform X2 [Macrobrachium nipponense]|uniref:uncharacterized protein LOC135210274 isoform X2 n=1 Tax=Macrobrachium nipponense TaxID=159736 RepID=UPI0030C802EC